MNDLMEAVFVGAFGTGLSQHARLITLASAQGSELPELLMAERFTAREAVNELFVFDIDALSVSASLDLSAFIGEELTLTLLQPDGSRRAWHGICTAANLCGADGGVARYRLRLQPALQKVCLRRDSYIFQNKDVRANVTELLSDYPQVRCDFDITDTLSVRPICTQYNESDYAFFVRLLVSEGLSWRFEHAPAGGDERHARHKLLIFDSRAVAPPMPGGDVLRFHGVRAADTDDSIDQFGARREVQARMGARSAAGILRWWGRPQPSSARRLMPARLPGSPSTAAAANASRLKVARPMPMCL